MQPVVEPRRACCQDQRRPGTERVEGAQLARVGGGQSAWGLGLEQQRPGSEPAGEAGALGQRIFDPPNVAGWKANTFWLTTSALSGRANLAKRVASLVRANGMFDDLITKSVAESVDIIAAYLGITLATVTRQSLIDAHQAERVATNGSNAKAITNLLVMAMLTAEMNVPS